MKSRCPQAKKEPDPLLISLKSSSPFNTTAIFSHSQNYENGLSTFYWVFKKGKMMGKESKTEGDEEFGFFNPCVLFERYNILIMKMIVLLFSLLTILSAEVIPFDNTAVEVIFQKKQSALFLFIDDETAQASAIEAFKAYDSTNPSIVLSLSSKNDGHGLYERLAEYLGVDLQSTPQVLYLSADTNKYQFDSEEITSDSLASFVERVGKGQVQQFLKSAPVPESNDEAVKVVVGKTFKELVLDSSKQVLVKFYAPWCGHCKHIAPHFDEAAKRLANNPNILLAKVDSTENEVAGLQIEGYPTIKFWRKDKSARPLDFNGERDADGIVQWLKEHTEYPWVESAAQEVVESANEEL